MYSINKTISSKKSRKFPGANTMKKAGHEIQVPCKTPLGIPTPMNIDFTGRKKNQ